VPDSLAGPLRTQGFVCRGPDQPADSSLDLISDKPNRWNVEGEPTVYLSGDPALALIESGRHPEDLVDRFRLFELDVRVPLVVDLRDEAVRAALELPDDLAWILDRDRTQKIAQALRHAGSCDGLVVPSAGALDQPDRFNVVVFADRPARIARTVTDLRAVGEAALPVER
jgi:RES domain-containing protein